MSRLSRRTFLRATGIACATGGLAWGEPATEPRRKLAILTTEWRYGSHAWHMGERFLVGYPHAGRWHQPPFDVVSAYVDQFPENDLSRKRAAEFGFDIYPSIDKALCLGGDSLAVDAVLIIGEHGKYPKSEFAQTQYPRYEFFKQVTEAYRKSGRSVPVFNDKHLSWKWDWAKEMVELSRELKFGFAAGSSLPMTWRMPDLDLPQGCPIEEVVGVAIGGLDSYDFHALEMMQCLVERRQGGETGVKSLQALRGDAVWQLLERASWNDGGLNPELFAACLARSQTLKQPETFSHRYPTVAQMREWVADQSPTAMNTMTG
ncbi:MAG: twin-arginine translocation signal domain-containing protein [Planctomycetaceae bacterium]